MSNKTLLRRPLPSNREKKHQERNNDKESFESAKKPTRRLPAIKTNADDYCDLLPVHHHDVSKNPTITHSLKKKYPHNNQNFDIFEDGDKNLMKPLGPEPFFSRKSIK